MPHNGLLRNTQLLSQSPDYVLGTLIAKSTDLTVSESFVSPRTGQFSDPRTYLSALARYPCNLLQYCLGLLSHPGLPVLPPSLVSKRDLDQVIHILCYVSMICERSTGGITHPLKISCGLAAPDVRLRISASRCETTPSQLANSSSPSAKPKLSTTGRRADTVKNVVPSFISSATIRPRRFATTP